MAFVTIKQLSERYPGFTESALRNMFQHRKANGLDKVVLKLGRKKMLIDEDKFMAWLETKREVH